MTLAQLPWQRIETAPRVDMQTYLGYDEQTAKLFGTPDAGLCLITWLDAEDDEPAMWQVQPFAEGLDCVFDENTSVTLWCPLSALVPSAVLS